MQVEQVRQRIKELVRHFAGDRRGNIAIVFALSVIPMVGFVGAAVDYSHANSVKVAVQAALDATALMLAKNAGSETEAQMQKLATKYFKAQFNRKEAVNPKVVVMYTPSNATVVLNATTKVKTDFMGLMGFKTLNVKASSTAAWGTKQMLRVALALDNTGSMSSDGKMTALKTAAKKMLSRLASATQTTGDVYVSIVPFAKDVNFGASNYDQPWVQWDDGTDSSWDGSKGTCSKPGFKPRSACMAQGTCSISGNTTPATCTAAGACTISGQTTPSTCTAAGTCSNSKFTTQTNCVANSATWTTGKWTTGAWTSSATWTPTSHNTWKGCVVDRGDATGPSTGNYDTDATMPTTVTPATLYVPEQYPACPQAVMSLNANWSAMNTLITNMSPAGNTNQSIGLQAGWQSLVGGGPFVVPAKAPGAKYAEHIVLLTDGLNTENRWYADQASIDAREEILCKNVKAAGITLWTIQVSTGGDPMSTLLQNCASDPSKFFLLKSADAIISTFDDITFKITQLHLAK